MGTTPEQQEGSEEVLERTVEFLASRNKIRADAVREMPANTEEARQYLNIHSFLIVHKRSSCGSYIENLSPGQRNALSDVLNAGAGVLAYAAVKPANNSQEGSELPTREEIVDSKINSAEDLIRDLILEEERPDGSTTQFEFYKVLWELDEDKGSLFQLKDAVAHLRSKMLLLIRYFNEHDIKIDPRSLVREAVLNAIVRLYFIEGENTIAPDDFYRGLSAAERAMIEDKVPDMQRQCDELRVAVDRAADEFRGELADTIGQEKGSGDMHPKMARRIGEVELSRRLRRREPEQITTVLAEDRMRREKSKALLDLMRRIHNFDSFLDLLLDTQKNPLAGGGELERESA